MTDTQTQTSALNAVIKIRYLDDTNAVFSEQDGFLSLKATLENEEGVPEEKNWERISCTAHFRLICPIPIFLSLTRIRRKSA